MREWSVGGKFVDSYAGLFCRNVGYTRCDVPPSVEQMDSSRALTSPVNLIV
jgi:hypothetical protein